MAGSIVVVAAEPVLAEILGSLADLGREIVGVETLGEARLIAELERPVAVVFEEAAVAGQAAEVSRLLRAIGAVGARLRGAGGEPDAVGPLVEVPAWPIERLRAWVAALGERPPVDPSDALALLRASYGEGLVEKARELARKVDAALVDGGAVEEARRLAHRFRGSAGTYGFPAFGELAGAIEEGILAGGEDGRARLVRARRRLDRWAPEG